MKNNTRKSSFTTVAKNTETMISIDLSIGLDFEVTKNPSGLVSYLPIVGTKSVTLGDFLEDPFGVSSMLDEPPKASKKIKQMIKYHEEDYQYAVIVFKLLKYKICEPLDCIRSAEFVTNDSGYNTWTFAFRDGTELSFVIDDAAANSIADHAA